MSRHQEPPHTDVSRNLVTVVVRGVLLGLRRRRTGLLPSGPKSYFQKRASFVFNLETKDFNTGKIKQNVYNNIGANMLARKLLIVFDYSPKS